MSAKKTVGIYGGTFSPPHLGHVRAAAAFLAAEGPDELLIIPALIPPHKQPDGEAPPEQRLQMCRLAFAGLPKTVVTDREIKRGGKSYSVLTLRELAAPDTRLLLLCGTDMFLSLAGWYCAEEVFRLSEIVGIRRESDDEITRQIQEKKQLYEQKYGAVVRLLAADVTEISSTQLRRMISAGEDTGAYLQPEVEAYIRKWMLYRV